jgi:DNA-directed RNA polymerase specialized sigma24 family protein
VETLVRRAQKGDPGAMNELLTELSPYVGRICGSIALDAGEDAVQETFVAVFRSLHTLREPAALRGWVRRIAVRESVRVVTARGAVPVDPAVLALDVTVPDGAGAVEVRAILDSLEPVQRAVLVLRDVEGLGEEEMAAALGVAPGTVKSRLSRARAAFRARWSA